MAVIARTERTRRGPVAWLRRQCGYAPLYPLGALAGLNLVDEFEQAAFGLFGPEIAADLNVSPALFGAIYIPMVALGMILPVVVGHLTDRYNRVTLAVLGGATWFLFSFATGLVTAFWMLALVRMFSVIGRSVAGPTHASLLVDYYDVSGRGFAFSIHQNAQPVGQFIGLIAGGALGSLVGWQAVFLLLPLPGLVFLFLVTRLKEPVRGRHEQARPAAETLPEPHHPAESVADAAVKDEPVGFWMSIKLLLGIRTWVRFAWVWLFLGAGLALSSVLPFYFAAVFGLDMLGRGMILGITTLPQIAGSVIAGIVSQRWMARELYKRTNWLITWSAIFSAVAFLGLAVAPTLWVAVAVVLVTIPMRAMAAVPVALIFAATIPARVRGQGFGAIWVMFALGFWFLPVALALGDATSFRVSMLVAAIPMLLAAVVAFMAGKFIDADAEWARSVGGLSVDELQHRAAAKKRAARAAD